MKKPINEIARLRRIAGLITEGEYQEEIMQNKTAEDLFQMFKDENLVNDRREYDEEDLMSAYSDLSSEEAGKLVSMLQNINEAKSSVSKEDKIQVIKEWIWFTCDEGQAKDDINKYNKMVDMYFASKDDVTKEDFKNIWNKVSEVWGVGDTGADSEGFPETWKDIQTGTLVNPGQTYEGKEKEEEAFGGINENSYLMAKNPNVKAKVEMIISTLKNIDIDGETMEYILDEVGMSDQMANQLVHNKAEYQSSNEGKEKEEEAFGGINEGSADEVPLTPKVKKFIDKAIADAKKDGEFENLVDADWFDNELIDELIDLFEDEDYDSASKEVKDYISKVISVKESQMNEALKPHVYDRMYNLSSITGKMEMIRAAEEIMNDLTEEGFEVPEIREFFTQLINEETF